MEIEGKEILIFLACLTVTSTKAPTTTLILSTANATEVIPTMKNPAKIGGMVTRGLYVVSCFALLISIPSIYLCFYNLYNFKGISM